MVSLAISRYAYIKAVTEFYLIDQNLSDNNVPTQRLVRVLNFLPLKIIPYLGDIDRQKIHLAIGKVFLTQAETIQETDPVEYIKLLENAERHYRISVGFDPKNIEPIGELAKTVFTLEKTVGNSFNALPYFENLNKLGPNIIEYQYEIARYYYFKGMEDHLSQKVAHIVAIQPSAYGKIKKEDFYSPRLNPFIQIGLEKASQEIGMVQKQAYLSLGRFFRDKKNITEAIKYYNKGMSIRPYENNENNYLFTGQLFLENKEFDKASDEFISGVVKSKKAEDFIKRIYYSFKKEQLFEEFMAFSRKVEEKVGNIRESGIFVARARIELGLYELARARLIQMNSEKQSSEAFFLLGVIAEKEKDWDGMELNSQRATVLDPDNCHYYQFFAKSLKLQKKYAQATLTQNKAKKCFESKKN